MPLSVNPVPLIVTFDTDTLVPPVLVIVPVKDWFEPTVTLPKLSDTGLLLSCPAVAAPVPDNGMLRVEFEALEVTVTAPLTLPVAPGANFTVKLVLCPAVRVNEELMPLSENPDPLMATFETETLVPPVFVIVPERDWLEPTVTLPKLREVGLALSCPGVAAPVPETEIVSEGFDASEVMVTVPLADPVELGENVTFALAVAPAARIKGVAIPPTVNPEPVIPTCEMVTLAVPVFVIVEERVWLCPTVILPKLRDAGLAPRVPTAFVPTPETGTVNVASEALEARVRLPFEVPDVEGANCTLKLALCPTARVAGALMPVRVYPAPLILAREILTLALPVFVTVPKIVWVLPTVTLPKLRLARLDARVPTEP